jgi:Fe-S-cluster containining protein
MKPPVSRPIINCTNCTHCGFCCRRWDVRLSKQEIRRISGFGLDLKDFMVVRDRPVMKMYGTRKDCAFLDKDNLCVLHRDFGFESKPKVCRDYPKHPKMDEPVKEDYIFYSHSGKLITRDVIIQLLERLKDAHHTDFFDMFSQGLRSIESNRPQYLDTFNFDQKKKAMLGGIKQHSESVGVRLWSASVKRHDMNELISLPHGKFSSRDFINKIQKMVEKNELLYPNLTEKLLRFFYLMRGIGRPCSTVDLLKQLDKFNRRYV